MQNLLKGFFLLLLVALLGGCKGGGGGGGSIFGTSTSTGTDTSVVSIKLEMFEMGTTTPTAVIGAGGANQDGPADVVATVTKNGAPVSGALVTFTTQAALATFSPTAGTARSDDQGKARISLLAGAEQGAGELMASATVTGVTGEETFVYEVTSPVVGGVTVSVRLVDPATGNDLVAPATIGRDQSARVIATVIQKGEVVVGAAVNFSTTGGIGSLSEPSALTGSNGEAVVDMTAGSVVGASQLTASATLDSITARDSIGFIVESTSRNTINLDVQVNSARTVGGVPTIGASADDSGWVIATLTDIAGDPIHDEVMVTFTTSNGIGVLSPVVGTALTNPTNGRARIQLLAGDKLGASLVTARATVGAVTAQDSAGFTVDSTSAGPGGLTVSVSVSPNQIDSVTPGAVVATVRDSSGNAPATPVVVEFSTANGIGVLSQTSDMTDASGNAEVELTTGEQVGADHVIATVTLEAGVTIQASSPFNVISVGDPTGQVPTSLFLNLSSTQLDANADTAAEGVTITATVTDDAGRVVEGALVNFALTPANGGVLVVGNSRTDASGIARATLTTGGDSSERTITVTATVQTQTTTVPPQSRQVTVVPIVDSLELLVSSIELRSDADLGPEGVVLTGIVRDARRNPVPNIQVFFGSDSGEVLVTNPAVTDASGRVEAILTTGGNPVERSIRVTAEVEGLTWVENGVTQSVREETVNVVGVRLNVDGPSNVQAGVDTTYVVTLTNSAGALASQNVCVVTEAGNQLVINGVSGENVCGLTSVSGQLSVTFTAAGTNPASTLTVSGAGGDDVVKLIGVSDDIYRFVDATTNLPLSGEIVVPINQLTALRVEWLGPAAMTGETINFATTRGTFGAAGNAQATAVTDAAGRATVEIIAPQAGLATVMATNGQGATATAEVRFQANLAELVILQAAPVTLNTDQTSTITATVRDSAGNLVANKEVSFSLVSDNTGGSLSFATRTTDNFGQASVVYTPGIAHSSLEGVTIRATALNEPTDTPASASADAILTVTDGALRISMGTGNEAVERDITTIELPYTAMVTDGAGNPAPDAALQITIDPTWYAKGYYGMAVDNTFIQVVTAMCQNEDLDRDGILDPGEDVNKNDRLDPANPASVPRSPALANDGTVLFNVTYLKDRGNWLTVDLTGWANVDGSEASAVETFVLPILETDAANPPGNPSPYGMSRSCFTERGVTLILSSTSTPLSATAYVRDHAGGPIVGALVTFSTNGTAMLRPASGVTGEAGTFTIGVEPSGSGARETLTVTATLAGNDGIFGTADDTLIGIDSVQYQN